MAFSPELKTPKSLAIKYPKVTLFDVLSLYAKPIRKYWFSSLCAVLGIATVAVMEIITPLYYKDFFELIASRGQEASVVAPQLTHIVWFILGLNGVAWLAYRISNFGLTWVQSKVMSYLGSSAFDYMLDHSYSFFSNNFTGALTQRINRYARAFERLTDKIVWDIIPLTVKVVGMMIVVWFINHLITYILLGWLFVFILSNYLIARWKLKYDIQAAELDSKVTRTLSDAMTNHNSVQLFVGQKAESKTFLQVVNEWGSMNRFRWTLENMIGALQAGMMFAVEFLLFYYGVQFWEKGLIGIGVFILVQTYFLSLADRLWNIGSVIRHVYEGFADAKEMAETLKLEHEIRDIPAAGKLEVPRGEIEFKNVTFGFNQTRSVLKGIDLKVASGEKVALVGPSGAGKSTFVRLILRLYDVASGAILVDGQNISKVTQESLRQSISLVPQDPVLFHRTLMENIRYGRREATDAEVIVAAKLAHCDDFIDVLPTKYETYVGERGIKLSGGERQRVAIARAILKNAPILVLDEATSSLDSHSEALIQDALDTLMKGKTTLVIAHRLSTIRKMDRIVVLQDGEVFEQGTHEELIAKSEKAGANGARGGLYAKLWSLQAGGFLKEMGEDDGGAEEEDEENLNLS